MAGDGRFLWYELMTTDMAAAGAFYADVVGWGRRDASAPGLPYTLFTLGKTSVCGLMNLPEAARGSGATPRWIGYVGVDDVDATARRVGLLGGVVHVGPQDIPNVSRFAAFSDPQKATLALFKWLMPRPNSGADNGPASGLNAVGRVGWNELFTVDTEAAFAFYGALFGWQKADIVKRDAGAYQRFSSGGEVIGGICTKPEAMPNPIWFYYFNVGDIDAASARVRAGGGAILNGPTGGPDGSWMLECTDPQGGMFALIGKRSSQLGFFERSPRQASGPSK